MTWPAPNAMPLLSISEATAPHSQIHRLIGTVAHFHCVACVQKSNRRVALSTNPRYSWRRR